MKVLKKSQKLLLSIFYYFFHKNILVGILHKNLINKFYYKNFTFNLNIKNIPISVYSSFFFKTYEINDRILVERNITSKNACIIIGGGLGFIPVIVYSLTKKKILVFEINKSIISNLKHNLIKNSCEFLIYNKNVIFSKRKIAFYENSNFLATSEFLKTKKILQVDNLFFNKIKNIKNYNTLVIDAEGAEYNFIINISKMKYIKYIFFELHYNLLTKNKIEKLFNILNSNSFSLKDKFFNSYYFEKII